MTDKSNFTINPVRLKIVLFIPALLLIFLIFSAYKIQVVNGEKHKKVVQKLSFTQKRVNAVRGFILDRKLEPLAVPTQLYSVVTDPVRLAKYILKKSNLKTRKITEEFIKKNGLFQQKIIELSSTFAKILHDDPYIITERLFRHIAKGARFLYLKRQITENELNSLKQLKLPSYVLWFPLEPARHYPSRELASQVLGFTSFDGKGIEGVEKKFDVELTGSTSVIKAQKDARSGTLLISGLPDIEVGGANHVVLTIDSLIQTDTEKHLNEGLELYKAKYGTAVVMNAKTGEILALANAPNFDPSRRFEKSPKIWRNRAVVDAYELGSVIKPLTMLGALDSGAINKDSDIPLDFKVIFKNKAPWTPKDHIPLSQGTIKPADIIAKSSNKGISKVAELFGPKGLYGLFSKLGFGIPTGIELPSENRGFLPPLKQWSNKVYLATHSYGHGFTVTLIQLLKAYSVFANNGYIVSPHVVKYVVNDKGQIVSCYFGCSSKIKKYKIISNVNAINDTLEMMKQVVVRGTGKKASLKKWGYSVAGKTGTAEKIDKSDSSYSTKHNRVTFVGLVPASDPKLIIAVMYDDPEGDPATARPVLDKNGRKTDEITMRKDAGYISAPVFAKIAKDVLFRMGIPPDLDTIKFSPGKKAKKSAHKMPGPYMPPLPKPSKIVMPDFTGKSLKEALNLAYEAGLDCKISGYGRVVYQNPEPGGPMDHCNLILKPKKSEEIIKEENPQTQKLKTNFSRKRNSTVKTKKKKQKQHHSKKHI